MLTLHGSPISNYYNKVKLALLEKGVPFREAHAATHSTEEAILAASPLGKIPFITTAQGGLCESQPLLEWIEASWPQPPLLPADAFAAAKVRELTTFLDWHLEIVARQLYGAAFFGAAPLTEGNAARIRKQLTENIAAFKRLAKFSPKTCCKPEASTTRATSNSSPNAPRPRKWWPTVRQSNQSCSVISA